MPNLEYLLTRAGFTPDEIKLSSELEKIIFCANHTVHPGETLKGIFFSDIKKSMYAGSQYDDQFILTTLKKLEKVEFDSKFIPVITLIRDRYYSNL